MTGIPGTVGRSEWRWPRAPGRPRVPGESRLDTVTLPPLVLHATAFLALAVLATTHWAALVEPNQTRRALVASLVATAGGVLIGLSGRLPRLPGLAVRILLLVGMALIATTAMGIRFKLLMPGNWDTLGDRVSGGLSSVGAVTEWPYGGPNVWLRLSTLLAVPLVLVVASAVTFWPRAGGARPVQRAVPLVLLVALYGIAVAARPFDHQALRGIALLVCLAAWIWLPRMTGRDAAAAATAIAVGGLLALVLTPQVASTEPWVDYRHWSWTLHKEKVIGFDWRHSYGPLHWPRKGTKLLLIKAKNPHYWKAQTLDRFDGAGWTTSSARGATPSFTDTAISSNPKWTETVRVTVRGLKSELVIGPGSLLGYRDLPGDAAVVSNGAYLLNSVLKSGDSYSVRGYTPDPTSKQMRAAPPASPTLLRYTTIDLPNESNLVTTLLHVPIRGRPFTGDPDAVQRLESSRYARVYHLAQQVAGNARTDYDVVRRIGGWLEDHYKYAENVPNHRYPIEAFLFDDRKGYCQQFSGAAALMLRTLGIPTRVVSGFAPGTLDNDTHEYVVTDLDAHAWIEVWFAGIGWVPFDPTPAQAPAASQAASFAFSEIASAARGDAKDKLLPKLREQILGAASKGAGGAAAADKGTPWGWVAAGIAAGLLALAAVLVSVLRVKRRRRPLPAPCGDADVDHLVRLLGRLGLEIAPGTTLLELEQRMERLGGAEAAGYAQRLRRRRFGSGAEPCPDRGERRRLRRLLAAAVDAGPLARVHLAMPDNLGMRSALLELRRLQRSR